MATHCLWKVGVMIRFCLAAGPLWPQAEAVNARLTGTVLDVQNAPVPEAKVILSSPGTRLTRQVTTGDDGHYVFPSIPPGQYQLRVEKTGFNTYLQSNVVLAVGQSSTLSPKLEPGLISQVVEVAADAPILNSGNANIGSEVSGKQVAELPLNLRNVFNLAQLSSSVNNSVQTQGLT